MKGLGEVLAASARFLKERGIPSSRLTAEELIAFVLKMKRIDLYLQFDRPLEEGELSLIRPLLKRASFGEPVEYILGETSFYHTELSITPAVLIPRPETEIFVDLICKELAQDSQVGKEAWDLCTGSGCIGISVKKACPDLKMTLSDLSEKALELAGQNAVKNAVEVECLQGDLLEPFQGKKADFIFCNPPYISETEYKNLEISVKGFEPKVALVGGEDGLDYYRRLKECLPTFLQPKAKVFFEIGTGQGAALMDLYTGPMWTRKRIEKDWAGHDRFFFLEFESVVL